MVGVLLQLALDIRACTRPMAMGMLACSIRNAAAVTIPPQIRRVLQRRRSAYSLTTRRYGLTCNISQGAIRRRYRRRRLVLLLLSGIKSPHDLRPRRRRVPQRVKNDATTISNFLHTTGAERPICNIHDDFFCPPSLECRRQTDCLPFMFVFYTRTRYPVLSLHQHSIMASRKTCR